MTTVVERPAASDTLLDAVMMVMLNAFPQDFGERWTRPQLARLLEGDERAWLAVVRADDAADLCGFALTRTVADEAELMLLAVRRDARRRGLASALLSDAFDHARRQGARSLFAEVRAGNPAEDFYRINGLAAVGRRPRYYRSTDGMLHDAVTMRRSL